MPCTLPASVCVNGRVKGEYSVRSVFAEQVVDGSCRVLSRGKFVLTQVGCSSNYRVDGAIGESDGSAACIDGTFVGGFMRNGPPACKAKSDIGEGMVCAKCGPIGSSGLTTQLIGGMVRDKEGVTDGWSCHKAGGFMQCTCKC